MPLASAPEGPVPRPWAYFITFSCYGTKLHGRPEGSVDRSHHSWKGRYLDPSRALHDFERGWLASEPVRLDADRRKIVLSAIVDVCRHTGWILHAAHVRSTHVHAIVSAPCDPEEAMAKFKAYASRALNLRYGPKSKLWTRHGSTVWLWEPREVEKAVSYVIQDQGPPMESYENPARWQEYLRQC